MVFCREHGSDHEIKVAPRVTLVLDRIKILSKTSFFMTCPNPAVAENTNTTGGKDICIHH